MTENGPEFIHVIDSHTGGEPTRVVMSGGPDLGAGPVSRQLERLRERHDRYRSAVVNEPRGNDVLVGAWLCEAAADDAAAAVIFFNNVGYLGMCGHGTIGLAVTLAHAGRLDVGDHWLETPAGRVRLTLHDASRVSVENVPSFRLHKDYELDVPGIGRVRGDIAWGGNWFFLVGEHGQSIRYRNVDALTAYAWNIRQALDARGVRGPNGELIDHVELFGPPDDPAIADSRNFVLCPGKAYDRSPCGTGTSAKVACLHADGKLAPGQAWRQQSITGSVFSASVRETGDGLLPTITGEAFVTAEARLVIRPDDPFRHGLSVAG